MGARFLRIGIAGFKSFADSTTLEILPGLTGVVGPNGCGKSNVAEALRWAMGESNARYLRGGEMDDVIFAGTANRPSRNLAEVSLHLEGDPAGLPPPFTGHTELQVTRRIERGAGSAYRVNGREARARDVQTLFADLASGARASAMVSQGRVSALVNARPEERRAVLEEAAGIGGLHSRRAEAEMRLRATETNLERAEERRVLLDGQLDGLRGQAKQAARYRTVVEALLETEVLVLAIQQARAALARAQAETALRDASELVQRASIATISGTAEAARARTVLPTLRERENAAATTVERARLSQETVAADLARAEAALAGAQQRRSQLARDQAHAETVLQDAEAADARLMAEAERLRQEITAAPQALEAARAAVAGAAADLQQADQRAAETATVAAEAQAVSGALRQTLDQAEARARRAQEATSRAQAEQARATAQLIEPVRLLAASDALARTEASLSAILAALEQAETDRPAAAAAASHARDAHQQADTRRHKLAAETAALIEVLAVKDHERWPPLIDQLTVPAGLEAALGAALGEELAAAEDRQAARHWRALPDLPQTGLPGRPLSGLVRGPELLDRALGAIGLVMDDAAGAAAQAALQPGQSLVSASGAVWRWDGYCIRAGTPTAAAVRLQQRNRLSGLREQLATAEQDEAAGRAARVAMEAAEREAAATEQKLRTARRDAEQAAERARSTGQALRAQAETAASRVRTLGEQIEHMAPEWQAATAALDHARAEHARRPEPTALRAMAEAARVGVVSARAADGAAHRGLDALQRADHARQGRLASIGREREDRRMRATDLAGRVTDLVARAAQAAAEHERLVAAPGHAARAAERAGFDLNAAEAALREARSNLAGAERAAEATSLAAQEAERAGFAAREALVRAEGAREVAEAAWAASEARIVERAGSLPPLPSGVESSAAAEERARTRQSRLTRERDEMGPVNLRAEIEARTIEADVAAIVRESEELSTAVAKLRGSIGHLNREGRERLSAVFHAVDNHFQTLFGRMFGGGRAHLALVGSDDPLLAGLEIYAQPPGKKLTSLALLSGGEQALTALSLIFAVFRCNPAPLCVLDEVDAPLDDANVERFCALLADMVQETGTRFLVVTHHQVTMARMDRLYGVTMQERGVSRLLSVDLSRAAAMVGTDGVETGALAAE